MNPFSIKPMSAVIALASAAGIGAGTGWTVNGWRLKSDIADIKAEHAKQDAGQSKAALNDFIKTAGEIKGAADQHLQIIGAVSPKLDQISKDLKNAKPLPTGCRPDAHRMRNLSSAIDTANQAAAR